MITMDEVKAVAVLTTFQDLPRSYGLVPVVLNQLKQLVKYGYEVGFYTQDWLKDHIDAGDIPEGVEFIPRVPMCHLFDYQEGTKEQDYPVDGEGEHGIPHNITNFKKQVERIEEALEPWLMEYPTVITHDILLQTSFVPHNQAIRNIAKKHPKIRWIHWLHSGPSVRPTELEYPHTLRFTGMPNSIFVSPNESMREGFAAMYDIPLKMVKTVYHTLNTPEWFEMHPLSVDMIKKYRLYDCDGLVVWPTRIDHLVGKGMYIAIRLVAQMNRFADIKFLFLNSWCNTPEAKKKKEALKDEATKWGLPRENLMFSSEMGPKWEQGVPHQVVRDMLNIGEIYINTSQSETFSLSMLEAAAHKNMIILNEDLDVFRELGEDRVDYVPTGSEWGGTKVTRHYWENKNCPECDTLYEVNSDKKIYVCSQCGNTEPAKENPRVFWREKAHNLLARLGLVGYHCEHCGGDLGNIGAYRPLMQHRHALRVFNDDWVFANQLEPLLKGEW